MLVTGRFIDLPNGQETTQGMTNQTECYCPVGIFLELEDPISSGAT